MDGASAHSTAYSRGFFDQVTEGSLSSARVILGVLFEYYKPESIVDVGCGRGAWLKAASECGVQDIVGIDGEYVERDKLLIDERDFQARNLAERIELPRRFGLAISLEVAEHLPFYRSESFVADLVGLSDTVLFSAALPYQGGTDHVNEQWLEFWAILFRRHGYVPSDLFRRQVWNDERVKFWYSQNLILFCKEKLARELFPADTIATDRPLSFPHPLTFLVNITRYRPLSGRALDSESQDYRNVLAAYLSGETDLPLFKILNDLFPHARTQTVDAEKELARRDGTIQQLSADLSCQETEIGRLSADLSSWATVSGRLSAGLSSRETEIGRLSADLSSREADIRRLDAHLLDKERKTKHLEVKLTACEATIDQVSNDLTERRIVLTGIQESFYWRILTRVQLAKYSRRVKNSGLFDRDYYLLHNTDVADAEVDPLEHYFIRGAYEGRDPHPAFDTSFYLSSNPDVAKVCVNPLAHYIVRGADEGRDPSPLFDGNYYKKQNPAISMNPLVHYWAQGARDGRNPHPLFDTRYYLEQNRDVAKAGQNPLAHYLEYGAREGRDPHPLFDTSYYLEQNPDIAGTGENPLAHYLKRGAHKGRDPHPLFDTSYYLEQNPDVAGTGQNPLVHYLTHGARERRAPHPLFDTSYYVDRNRDVAEARVDPLVHYLANGANEGRAPHPLFDTRYYLEKNPEVAESRTNPLAHYVTSGAFEGKDPHPLFDTSYYLEKNIDVSESRMNALVHYLETGAHEGRDPHPLFQSHYYTKRNPEVAKMGMNPLTHYVLYGAYDGRDPHPQFDSSYYLAQNPDVAESQLNPLAHYLGPGAAEGRVPSPHFDTCSYLEENPEIARKGLNPLVHYVTSAPPFDLRAALRSELKESKRVLLGTEYDSCPLISVVIPCFNQGRFLEDAVLSSLLACSHPLEIIVVDDGSTDPQSVALVNDLAEKYKFTLVRQANAGRATARNVGIRHARGKFIQLLDGDDLLAPEKIDIQLDEFRSNPEIDICISEYELCNAAGLGRWVNKPSTIEGFPLSPEDFLLRWERGLSIPIHCPLFRREILEQTPFQLVTHSAHEDWIFWVEVSRRSPKFKFNPAVLAAYRIHGKNTVSNHEVMGLDFLRACMHIVETGLDSGSGAFLQDSIRHFQVAYLESIKNDAVLSSRTQR